jgi:hypothetical protein
LPDSVITERDYTRKIVPITRSSKETAVRDIMTTSVMYVLPDFTSKESMAMMTEHRLQCSAHLSFKAPMTGDTPQADRWRYVPSTAAVDPHLPVTTVGFGAHRKWLSTELPEIPWKVSARASHLDLGGADGPG